MPDYFLPPEWAPQSGTMLTWPHRESYWQDNMAAIDRVFVDVAKAVGARQKLLISCLDEAHELHIKQLLLSEQVNLSRVFIYQVRADDIWVRDHGPLSVIHQGGPLLLDFAFNGWGNKYPEDNNNQNDNLLTRNLHDKGAFNVLRKEINMALEGGGIEVDGHGTLLATRSNLFAKTRNPHLSEQEIEAQLKHYFGLNRILWLEHGALAGDDTDGHIDTLARFARPNTICYMQCTDPQDEHFDALKAMEEELTAFKDYQGNPYRLVPLPWPKAHYAAFDGKRLPITYANFLIINGAVLVPTYNDPADLKALSIIADCFPDREIIAVLAGPVVEWYGSIHCMTMQLLQGILK